MRRDWSRTGVVVMVTFPLLRTAVLRAVEGASDLCVAQGDGDRDGGHRARVAVVELERLVRSAGTVASTLRARGLRVIALTAATKADDETLAREAGADRFVRSEDGPAELLEAIRREATIQA